MKFQVSYSSERVRVGPFLSHFILPKIKNLIPVLITIFYITYEIKTIAYKRDIVIGLPEIDIIKRIAQRTAAVHDQITFIFVFERTATERKTLP